uniref:EH domain-containing protein 3-like isoform X2 n=1 Tax=Styela clava TaxID=7725 RepID=UPI00193A55E1|nr:EH domain-containing protein 3-like isoform X2 [Styela clava]
MLRWLRSEQKEREPEVFQDIAVGLKKLYKTRLRQLEEAYKFHDFHSPALDDADFESKPMVLLIGQYSTGKTTFIKYLLDQEFPGMRIGPEPTTDCFITIMKGDDSKDGGVNEGVIPGNALVVDKTKPFRALTAFGNAFLSRLQCSQLDNEVLSSITIIDTPGILSGEKQRVNRGYEFDKVLGWFAERVDRIILLFDAHKLDISDEFHQAINAVKSYDSKIRVVLNKSDQVNTQQLMRVYGALMWSLGKVITTPEVVRVYIGSFWDEPLNHAENRALFEKEKYDLFEDIQSLPRNAALRKLNDLIKRARLAKVNAYIISHLHDQMPSVFGKEKAKAKLISDLDKIFQIISDKYKIPLEHVDPSKGIARASDFPNVNEMRENLKKADFSKFKSLNESMIRRVDDMLAKDIAELMKLIQKEEAMANQKVKQDGPQVKGGAFATSKDNPFSEKWGVGVNAGIDEGTEGWIVEQDKPRYDEIFHGLKPINGKVKGSAAKPVMEKSKLNNTILSKIWKLADHDKDGALTDEEFALSMHLIQLKVDGHDLPDKLPEHLIPPSQRTTNPF